MDSQPPVASAVGAGFAPGHYGARTDHPGVFLSERSAGAVHTIFGQPRSGGVFDADDRVEAGRYHSQGHTRWMPVGPREWLVLGDAQTPEPAGAAAFLDGEARMFDLTHARTIVRLSGEHAADVLAKGCPLDLTAMEPGSGASSVLGPFSVVIMRDAAGYEVVFNRTYARSGWEWLVRSSLEFGVEIQAAQPWTIE